METCTSVLQSGNWANRTVEAKVRTIQKTMTPVLSRENASARRKRQFSVFPLFSYSSFPDAVAEDLMEIILSQSCMAFAPLFPVVQ